MTMLDRMRRHRNWLKWSLGLVVLAFVIFYIPDFLQGTDPTAASNETVAVIEGDRIRADEFRRIYQAQLQTYRSAYGGNMSDRILKQLGVEQQILQQLVDERAALAEAQRLGLTVSDEEVAQRIFSFPAFQEKGAFIGTARYQQLLASQRPPLTTAEFEENVRRGLAVDKLRASVTEWLSISDKELEQEYRRRNDKIKLSVLSFNTESYRSAVTVSDADIATYFQAHTENFRIPEKRKVKYLLIDVEAIRAKLTIPPADVERAYNDGIDQYTTPEQIRASHILLKTEGKDEASVRAKAEEVLKQAKAGGDFAALARTFSEDEANAKNGGDLDFFGRGRMVPEFDTAAFAMEAGQISDLVKTQFGFHIIKVTEKKPGAVRPLDEVRQQLVDQIGYERAQAQATTLAETIGPQIKKPTDLDVVATAHGLTAQETGFFARNEPILGVGGSPEMASRAFSMKVGEVSGMLRASRGFVFQTLTATQDSHLPKLDEVKDRVRDEIVAERARDMAKQKATEVAAKLKTAPDFEKAAKVAGVEAKTTERLTRDQPRPEAPAEVIEQAFKLAQGAVSEPITTNDGMVVVKVVEKLETTAEEITAKRPEFREELLADRRTRFFNAYLQKAKEKMKIQVNREALQKVVG
jgi:peptidyl-prolyl cis-trans isomerase D